MKSFLSEWDKFRGWAVLLFFLNSPEKQIHVKGLAKQLGISPLTANVYLNLYAESGLLEKEKVANALFFKLKDNPVTRQLKRFLTTAMIFESGFIEMTAKEMHCNSVVLFGSHANGSNDSDSDLDLLIISSEKNAPKKALDSLKKGYANEVNLVTMSLGEWRQKLRQQNGFIASILRNHIILYGSDLVE